MEFQRKEGVFCHDGFVYYSRRSKDNIRYLCCKSNRQYGCKATAKLVITEERQDFIMINAEHNNAAPKTNIDELNFKEALKDGCLRESGGLKTIYDKIARRFATTAVRVPYNVVRSSMSKWRRLTTPIVPRTLQHLGEILNSGEYPKYTVCDGGLFFSGTVLSANGDSAIVLGNPEFVRHFVNAQYVFIDGTFKSVPRKPKFSQILTIFATCMDHAFPLLHILMENRTKALYDAVFQYVKASFPNFVNENIMTDYETALVHSLRDTFEHARLHGCYFHYCQAVFRKARALGIVRRIENNQNGQLLLKKYYALPLLPAEMIEDTLPILEQDEELANLFRYLHAYVQNFWIRRITPQRISVFEQRHRTNNVMESYHRRLNSKLVRHPNVWDLLDTLISNHNTANLEFAQLERGKAVFRVASKNVLFHSRLRQAWAKIADGRFTAEDFLRQAVHFTESLHSNLHYWERHADDANHPTVQDNHQNEPPQLNPPLLPQPIINEPPPLFYFHHNEDPHVGQAVNRNEPPLLLHLPSTSAPPLEPLPSTSTSFQAASPSIPQPIINEPPPLFYFRRNEVSPENPQTPPTPDVEMSVQSAPISQNPPSQEEVEVVELLSPLHNPPPPEEVEVVELLSPLQNPPSSEEAEMVGPVSPLQNLPSPTPNYNFPPIPNEVGRLFAALGQDDLDDVEIPNINVEERWTPLLEPTEFTEDMDPTMRCSVCYINSIRYAMPCGHLFCPSCASELYNVQNPTCAVCRTNIVREPVPLYFHV